jgi:aldehyde:ferredoxin oxidoreductase
MDRSDDRLPWRLMNETQPEGPLKGFSNSREELDMLLDQYYDLHGWDKKTSWPTAEVLRGLNLEDQLKQLSDKIKP